MLTYDLSERGTRSMYEYLYQCMKRDIIEGMLRPGEKLPSKREFAKHHQISLKTVENTYEQLLVEGYIYAEEKKGYYVTALDPHRTEINLSYQTHVPFFVHPMQENREEILADFTSNQAANEAFPQGVYAKLIRAVLQEEGTLVKPPFQGIYELREAIARYLYGFRGMSVSPDQIVVGPGMEYLYEHLIPLLGRDAVYALEDPGYQHVVRILKTNQVRTCYIPVDENGIQVDRLACSEANIIHVSPGHHFPTGIIMPITRRTQLLDWAQEKPGRYIIEDDFDSEFRFSHMPIPSIQSLQHNHRVIYMNGFSKTLASSISISYMVLPRKLMEEYQGIYGTYPCGVPALEQYALARFINQGYFERHIQRMKKYYKEKRDRLLRAFLACPQADYMKIEEKDAGNHFLMRIHTGLSDTELKWFAKEHGILLDCLSEYCTTEKEKFSHTIIVNYSDLEEERFLKALTVLGKIMEE